VSGSGFSRRRSFSQTGKRSQPTKEKYDAGFALQNAFKKAENEKYKGE
jgi:hypothetical protein